MIIEPEFFNQIRTEQQLGYIVWSGYYNILYRHDDFGLFFFIQCSKTLQEIIQQDIEAVANNNSDENKAILNRHIEHLYNIISEELKLQVVNSYNNFLGNPETYTKDLIETIKGLSIDDNNAENAKQALLNQGIDQFVQSMTDEIEKLTNKDFEKLRQSLITELTKKPTNRDEVLNANFTEIMIGRNQFTRNQELAETVKAITKEELLEFYKKTTQGEQSQRKTIIGQCTLPKH